MDSLPFLLYRHLPEGEMIPTRRPETGMGSAEVKADE